MIIFPEWGRKRLVPTKSAQNEMDFLGFDLWEVANMLENGQDCGRRRKEGVCEVCFDRGNKTIRIVCAESLQYSTKEVVWLVTHVGIHARR